MRSMLRLLMPVLAVGLLGCEDDKGDTGTVDAPVDMVASDRPPEAVADVPDAAVTDTPPVQDQRPNIDCAAIGCGASLAFKVPGFITRFGAEARVIDVTACRGTSCADARVQLPADGVSMVSPGDGGPDRVSAGLLADVLSVTFTPSDRPTSVMSRQEQVRLRIVTSGGRGLVDFTTQAPVDVFCPGGLGCGVCEATYVDLDSADGGTPVDANQHPGRNGVCQ